MSCFKGTLRAALQSKSEQRSLKAIEKLQSPQDLVRVVREARHLTAREAALKKIDALNLLVDIAQSSCLPYSLRMMAVSNIAEQDIAGCDQVEQKLERVACSRDWADTQSESESIALTALGLIHNPHAIKQVALSTDFSEVCLKAIERMENQDDLVDLAVEKFKGCFCSARMLEKICEKLQDPHLFAMIFEQSNSDWIKLYVAKKIPDATALLPAINTLAQSAEDPEIRLEAALLGKEPKLIEAAQSYHAIRYRFSWSRTKSDQSVQAISEATEVVKGVRDYTLLVEIASKAEELCIRKIASQKVIEQADISQIKRFVLSDSECLAYEALDVLAHTELDFLRGILSQIRVVRVEQHACGIIGHVWDGCQCMRCGALRNEGHDWAYKTVYEDACGTSKCPRGGVEDWVLCGGAECPGTTSRTIQVCRRCGA